MLQFGCCQSARQGAIGGRRFEDPGRAIIACLGNTGRLYNMLAERRSLMLPNDPTVPANGTAWLIGESLRGDPSEQIE